MKLYLVRHGQTDWNLENRAQGQVDNPLNATGISQAEELREKLSSIDFDACYCSPLKRAVQTAEIVTDGRLDIIFDDDLKERDFGSLEGTNSDTWKMDIYDRELNSSKGGIEPIKSVLERSKRALDCIKAKNKPGAKVLIVGHEALFRTLHFNIVGYDDNTAFQDFHLKNGTVAIYDI